MKTHALVRTANLILKARPEQVAKN